MQDESVVPDSAAVPGRQGNRALPAGVAQHVLLAMFISAPVLYTQLPLNLFLPLHALSEIMCIVLVACAASVGRNDSNAATRAVQWIPELLLIGLLDIAHFVSLPGMPDWGEPSGASKTIFFWLATRVVMAGMLIMLPLFSARSVPSVLLRRLRLAFVPGLAAGVLWVLMSHPEVLAALPVPQTRGALFAVSIGYAMAALGVVLVHSYLGRARDGHDGSALLVCLLILAFGEWCVALYSDLSGVYSLAIYVSGVAECAIAYFAMFTMQDRDAPGRHATENPDPPASHSGACACEAARGNCACTRDRSNPAAGPKVLCAAGQQMKIRMHAARGYARNVLDASLDPMLVVDLGGKIVDVNRAAEEITGLLCAELAGKDLADIFFQKDLAAAVLRSAFSEGQVRDCSLSIPHATGRKTEVMCNLSLHRDEADAVLGAFAVARDVTDLRQYETQMSFQATCDALTALPNRLQFRERLGRAMAAVERDGGIFALMFIDLDNFKDVNETLGHAAGDELLKVIANHLVDTLRPVDSIARMGGDEFAVLIEDVMDLPDAERLANRMRHALGKSHVIDGHEVAVSCSIGITLYPSDGRDIDTLLRSADTAMYRAKEEGKNNCQSFTTEMNDAICRRVEIGNHLRRALRASEFSLHYQPRAELAGGTIVGAEALIRWNSAELGAVSPAEFIPVAENNGLIVQIGEWVLHSACHEAMRWRHISGAPINIAVNLSARQFRDVDIVKTVMCALEESGLPPSLLELELTESMLMHDIKRVTRTLHALKDIGVRLAIDDFGTGYSSLSYLKNFPLDYLKVDRSFIKDIPSDQSDEAIVRAIVAMAHSLGIKVIAEGVETSAQLAFLLEQDCDEVQGFYFSKPLPAERMQEALTTLEPLAM